MTPVQQYAQAMEPLVKLPEVDYVNARYSVLNKMIAEALPQGYRFLLGELLETAAVKAMLEEVSH